MNKTKEWMILERIKSGNCKMVSNTGFAQVTNQVYRLGKNKYYELSYWDGHLDDISKVKDKEKIKSYEKE